MLLNRNKQFRRLIVKTNSESLTPEREISLREKINDPAYLLDSIDLLADSLSKAMSEGYLADSLT